MTLSICLYLHHKRTNSVYVYVRVSMYASIYVPILQFAMVPVSKIIHVFLKKAQMCISPSVSLKMLLYKSLNMSFQNYLYLYAYIWLKGHITQYAHISISKQISPYMSILQCPKTSQSIVQNLCFKYAPVNSITKSLEGLY